ncbi:hypothetical protein PVL29_008865 [Vitis rotundifolia]|uniref:VQ domain-containing protein n=1 Tax=Vitis rotundifolia TaxID=103349 RepID=A0AA39DUR6_VITRO|nr:hypothetical protein PVL29_008865 [Vitis rotundifolia]
MSPTKFHDEQQPRKEINGSRPSPLKINKDSHFINKPLSTLSFSKPPAAKHQQRHPVIIYTHSPKIIHTHARDFMALVQKLTGLSSSSDSVQNNAPPQPQEGVKASSRDDNESSSVLTDEHCGGAGDAQVSSSSVSPIFNAPILTLQISLYSPLIPLISSALPSPFIDIPIRLSAPQTRPIQSHLLFLSS